MSSGPAQRTVFRTHDLADGDKDIDVLTLDGIVLTPTSDVPVFIAGCRHMAIRTRLEIDTSGGVPTVTAIVFILPDDRS